MSFGKSREMYFLAITLYQKTFLKFKKTFGQIIRANFIKMIFVRKSYT